MTESPWSWVSIAHPRCCSATRLTYNNWRSAWRRSHGLSFYPILWNWNNTDYIPWIVRTIVHFKIIIHWLLNLITNYTKYLFSLGNNTWFWRNWGEFHSSYEYYFLDSFRSNYLWEWACFRGIQVFKSKVYNSWYTSLSSITENKQISFWLSLLYCTLWM